MTDALILGCSHAAGALMHEDPEYGARNSYPMLLAEMIGYTPHNHAISGGSNDAMFRIFTEQEHHYDLIIACWTGKDRGEFYHTEHKQWLPINYGEGESLIRKCNTVLKQGVNVSTKVKDNDLYENYGKQWLAIEGNLQRGINNKLKNILALNVYAQSKGTKVINIDSFDGIHEKRIRPFAYPKTVYRPLNGPINEFVGYCTRKDYPSEPRGHFFRPAHLSYATLIKDRLINTRSPLND
tara:strand:- start:537 stop:1253 length:717 start_codon:yes stop_codon:yes gene_type:complete